MLNTDVPIFVNSEVPTQNFKKPELERAVKKLGRGLREAAGLGEGDAVLVCMENSVCTSGRISIVRKTNSQVQDLVPCHSTRNSLCRGCLYGRKSRIYANR